MTRLEGKIIRDEKCPVNKTIDCESCEHYDGWEVDVKNRVVYVYCANQKIYDANKLNTISEVKNVRRKNKSS